jgi:hypothetical protein
MYAKSWWPTTPIDSLDAYHIVWRDQVRVLEHYHAEKRAWFWTTHGRDDTIPFPCPKTAISMAEIYEGVDLPGR